jgi:hypothetical protein
MRTCGRAGAHAEAQKAIDDLKARKGIKLAIRG